jgi:hypothetical protein
MTSFLVGCGSGRRTAIGPGPQRSTDAVAIPMPLLMSALERTTAPAALALPNLQQIPRAKVRSRRRRWTGDECSFQIGCRASVRGRHRTSWPARRHPRGTPPTPATTRSRQPGDPRPPSAAVPPAASDRALPQHVLHRMTHPHVNVQRQRCQKLRAAPRVDRLHARHDHRVLLAQGGTPGARGSSWRRGGSAEHRTFAFVLCVAMSGDGALAGCVGAQRVEVPNRDRPPTGVDQAP